MKKLKLILLLTLVFGAGLVTGVVGTRIAVRNFINRAVGEPDFLRTRVERDLVRRLKLDATQQVQVSMALRAAHNGIIAMGEESRPRLRKILIKANGEIEAVLTPGQLENYHRMQLDNRARWHLH